MNSKLVAYFSIGGTTRSVAGQIARVVGGDLYEILPEKPYTKDDLNWRVSTSRVTVEAHDDSQRPAIANLVKNMERYDTVFFGFPVWWRREPRIIDTFLESYDFSGKTLVPFVTSAGPVLENGGKSTHEIFGHLLAGIERKVGLGPIDDNLREICPKGAKLVQGIIADEVPNDDTLAEWIASLGVKVTTGA